MIVIPRFDVEVYDDREALLQEVSEAVELARRDGSSGRFVDRPCCRRRRISAARFSPEELAGADDRSCNDRRCGGRKHQRRPARSGRLMRNERVAFVGWGRSVQQRFGWPPAPSKHPRSIILCDLPSQRQRLESFANN